MEYFRIHNFQDCQDCLASTNYPQTRPASGKRSSNRTEEQPLSSAVNNFPPNHPPPAFLIVALSRSFAFAIPLGALSKLKVE
ncbi:Hypothetical protein NTJ_07619 [Nesidiocoris tenuis]|uniref:Uncharacterized protein n=1 Tax=Nesidiocoris tenuis TaxID=355587 RepID=A0ABN7ARG5_9HEMI|nr:Hypothetical protein NTJ_07619 [Nesidiocoris tenuis]